MYVLPKGTAREKGSSALIQHIGLIDAVMQLVKSCFGPNSSYKLIDTESGASFLTNDAFTIFTRVSLDHPLARVVAGAGVDAARSTGGGSTTTIIIAGQILKNLLPLLKQGIRQGVLVTGCLRALDRIREKKDAFSIAPRDPIELVRPIVRTSLAGTVLAEYSTVFEKIILDAIQCTRAYETRDLSRIDDIYVRTQVGGSLVDSRLVRGVALLRESIHAHAVEHLTGGKVLLAKGEFNIPKKGKTRYDHTFNVNSPDEYARMLRSKHEVLVDVMSNVLDCGANVVLVEKGVDDMAIDFLVKRGVIVIRRFPPQEFDHIISVTGAQPVSDFNDISPDNMVSVESVDFLKVAGNTWWFLEGFPNSRSCEIFVRGPNELLLKEAERLLKNLFKLVQTYLKEPTYVYGAGWYETAIARDLKDFARKVHGKQQIVIEKVAEAIEYIPALLAETSGMDPIITLADLRSLVSNSTDKFYGIDCHSRKVADVGRLGIIEPYRVKLQSIVSAFEAAVTVLRVDEVLRSRKLSKEERYYIERLEKTTPEATKKIQREYGI